MEVEKLLFSIIVLFRAFYTCIILLLYLSFYQIIKTTHQTRTRIEKIIYTLYATQLFHLTLYLVQIFTNDFTILAGPISISIFLFYPLMMILDIETWNVLAPLTKWVTPRRTLLAQIISFLISCGLLGGLWFRGFLYNSSLQDAHWAALWVRRCLPIFYVYILGYMLTKQIYFAYKMNELVDKSPEYQRVRTFHLSRKYRKCIRYQLYLAVLVVVAAACHFVTYFPTNDSEIQTLLKLEAEHTYGFLTAPILYLSSIFAILLQDLKLDTIRNPTRKAKRANSMVDGNTKTAFSNRKDSEMKRRVFSDKRVRFQLPGKSVVVYPESDGELAQ